jgi:hypothetical protein
MDVVQGQRGRDVQAFSTSGIDGRIVVWRCADLSRALNLKF